MDGGCPQGPGDCEQLAGAQPGCRDAGEQLHFLSQAQPFPLPQQLGQAAGLTTGAASPITNRCQAPAAPQRPQPEGECCPWGGMCERVLWECVCMVGQAGAPGGQWLQRAAPTWAGAVPDTWVSLTRLPSLTPPALPLPSSVGGEVVSGRHLGLGAGEPHGCLDCVPCCPPAVPRPPAVPLFPTAPPLSPATPCPPNVPHRADPALAPALQASLAPVSVLRDEALCLRGSGPETACGVLRTRRSWQPSWGLARCPELAGLSAPY